MVREFVRKLRLFCALLVPILGSGTALAKEPGWGLGVKQVELDYQRIVNRINPLIQDVPNEEWGDRVAIRPQLTLLKRGFFDSEWYFNTAYRKVMEVGLHFDTGVHVTDWADLVYRHHSSHAADRGTSFEENSSRYNLEDYVGLRLRFTP